MLAGAGTRWLKSIEEAGLLPGEYNPEMPRSLYPVRNYTPFGPSHAAIGIYALAALKGLGRHLLIVRGWEAEMKNAILEPLGIGETDYRFEKQEEFEGKPRGHGDAAWQAMKGWKDAEYIIVNFGGDASSPGTAFTSLAVMDTLWREGIKPSLLLPVAIMDNPPYPVSVNDSGLPLAFGHAKLDARRGGASTGESGGEPAPGGCPQMGGQRGQPPGAKPQAYSNIGLRLYRASELALLLDEMARLYRKPDGLWEIPGNDPESGEFALDNADLVFANRENARILAIARAEEITPVKTLQDLSLFEKAVSSLWKA